MSETHERSLKNSKAMVNQRKIQSFVRRSGRLTVGQKAGLSEFWHLYGVEVDKKLLDIECLFSKPQPTVLEIGFGNGDSLLRMAMESPWYNFLGVEVYQAGVGRLINEAHKNQLENLKIIKDDGFEVLKNNLPDDSLIKFQLFFPDPWHKKKHIKRRLVQFELLDLLCQKIINGGTVHMATDWQNYAQQMLRMLESHPHFKNTQTTHIYSLRPKHRPITKFERRGMRLGHKVWDLIFTCEK